MVINFDRSHLITNNGENLQYFNQNLELESVEVYDFFTTLTSWQGDWIGSLDQIWIQFHSVTIHEIQIIKKFVQWIMTKSVQSKRKL